MSTVNKKDGLRLKFDLRLLLNGHDRMTGEVAKIPTKNQQKESTT